MALNTINWKEAELKIGDFLFQQTQEGELAHSIRHVTFGYKGIKFDHLGILMNVISSKRYVIEANPEGVELTWLPDFLSKSHSHEGFTKTILGRLKPEYEHLITAATDFLISKISESYNPYFDFDKEGFYCSQLIHYAFQYANSGKPFFETRPMTFIDPDTKVISDFWKKYYEQLNYPVPEGKEGINPGLISISDKIDIIYAFGKIEDLESEI